MGFDHHSLLKRDFSGRLLVALFVSLGSVAQANPVDLVPEAGCWNYSSQDASLEKPRGTTYVDAGLTGPLPTNRWWSSLAWSFQGTQPYSERLYPHPLAVSAEADGLGVVYPDTPTIAADGRFYEYLYLKDAAGGWDRRDLLVGVVGLDADSTRVSDFSDWTVTARWEDGSRRMDVLVGHGLPFVYVRNVVGDALLRLNDYAGDLNVWHQVDDILAFTLNGHHYAAFAPPGATWLPTGGGLGATEWTSDLGGFDFFSVALLPDDSQETLQAFSQRSFAFVADSRVDWSFDADTSLLTATYSVTTEAMVPGAEAVPLLGLYPHHWKNSDALATAWSYETPRGRMKLVAAHSFQTRRRFLGVLPGFPEMGVADSVRLQAYIQEGLSAAQANGFRPDTYFGGKDLAKLAHLLPLMEQQGLLAERDAALVALRGGLEDWFDASDGGSGRFHYHEDWTTLVGYPASFGSADQLNDHHFHWGYLIQAAAAVARYDPTWAADEAWGGMVKMLIRDAANPDRDDATFPFLRNFDPYAGHSWASGHGNFAHGNNQESSSEDMNFATSLILWGEATANTTIRDLGIFLYTTESAAIENYWFDVDGDVFPSAYPQDTAAIIWGAAAFYATWWTAEAEAIHGINFLPFHGGSLYLGHHPGYLERNYANLVAENGGPEGTGGGPNDWTDVIWLAQAFYDPDAALAKFDAQADGYAVESGETRAHTYHWLANLQSLGRVDTTRWADRSTVAVFDDAGTRTYVFYNGTCVADTATFSDGVQVSAAPKTLVAHRVGETPRFWAMGACETGEPTGCDSGSGSGSGAGANPGGAYRFYLGSDGLSGEPPLSSTWTLPMAGEYSVGQLPSDPSAILTFEAAGLHGTFQGDAIRFDFPLDSDSIGDVTHLKVSLDFDADGADDYMATYHYFPLDASAGNWESYTDSQGILSEAGSFGDLVGGRVRVQLWNAFGNGDTRVDAQRAWLELPYSIQASSGSTPLPALGAPGLLLAALLLGVVASGAVGWTVRAD